MRVCGGCVPPWTPTRSSTSAAISPTLDRQTDAEWCFRRAADLGDTMGSFNLGNHPRRQGRWEEAVAAYEVARPAA